MLKIYGGDLSAPSNKVRFVANALDLKYEYVRVSLRDGEHRTPEYLKLHPAGKIPVIDDDGFVLFESGAIIKYLAAKENSWLYPVDLRQRALVEQWMDFAALHVGTAMGRVVFNRLFAPFAKVPVDERSLQDGLNFLKRFLPVVDGQLNKDFYLAGARLTLADLTLLSVLDPAEVAQVDLGAYPHILKWRRELQGKDFYTKCHKEYGEALKRFTAQRTAAKG